ncbi:hypothetical protein D3C76_972260 [compost metagenome]
MLEFDAFERQFEHADDGIHRGANFMTHGCQERTLGPVRFVGTFLGTTQVIEQLPPFADVDPATNDALDLTA